MEGCFATMASRSSWNDCSERNSEEPPMRRTRGMFPCAISARSGFNCFGNLREHPLLLQLLAVDAERRPGNGFETLGADLGAAVGADGVRPFAHAVERLFDGHEQVALGVGEREVQLLRVGAGGLIRQILNTVIGKCITGGFVTLV